MKIIFTIDALINAGTERSMLDLSRHFSKELEIQLVYFYPRHDLKAAYEAAGIRLHFLDIKGKYGFAKAVRALNKVLKAEKPDLVLSSLLRASLISRVSCWQLGIPLVGTFVNDSYGPERVKEHVKKGRWKFRFFQYLDRFTAGIPKFYISNALRIAIKGFPNIL